MFESSSYGLAIYRSFTSLALQCNGTNIAYRHHKIPVMSKLMAQLPAFIGVGNRHQQTSAIAHEALGSN